MVCVRVVHAWDVRRHPSGVGPAHPPSGSLRLKSGHQDWWQVSPHTATSLAQASNFTYRCHEKDIEEVHWEI